MSKTMLAEMVREFRKKRAWSQAQLAGAAGVDLRTIQRVEKTGACVYETLMAIASAFKIDVEELTSVLYQQKEPAPHQKDHSAHVNQNVRFLSRITEGRELCAIMWDADDFQYEHDELKTAEEANLVGAFLEEMGDSDVINELGAGSAVDFAFKCSQWLKELEENGFWVFGKNIKKRVSIAGNETDWQTAAVNVVRKNNPQISNVRKGNPRIAKVISSVSEEEFVQKLTVAYSACTKLQEISSAHADGCDICSKLTDQTVRDNVNTHCLSFGKILGQHLNECKVCEAAVVSSAQ